MGTSNIPEASDGQPIADTDHNSIRGALIGDQVPRNASGTATANEGDCGTETYPYKRANITTGYLFAGMIMAFHDYNALLGGGQGWMKCDGSVINETNYNALHGAGSWATYIGTSPLDSKYLPAMNDKYLVGATNTTQAGTGALTFVGNTAHSYTVGTHNHSIPDHYHTWYVPRTGTSDDQSYLSGVLNDIHEVSKGAGAYGVVVAAAAAVALKLDGSTDGLSTSVQSTASQVTNTEGGHNVDVQPESLEVEYWMRII